MEAGTAAGASIICTARSWRCAAWRRAARPVRWMRLPAERTGCGLPRTRTADGRLPPIPEARVGLAGPLYGVGAALAALGCYYATRAPIWAVIAHFGAVINFFNLIPVWQLDGSRGLRSLTRAQRGIVLATAVGLWMITATPMLLLISAGCAYRLFTRDWQDEPDNEGLMHYLGLLVAFAAIAALSAAPAAI